MNSCVCGGCPACQESIRETAKRAFQAEENDVLCSCGQYIDPDVCWCGESRQGHASAWDCGHAFLPMGCECLKGVKPVNWERYTGLSKEELEALKL